MSKEHQINRRRFIQAGAVGTGALIADAALGSRSRSVSRRSASSAKRAGKTRPNFLFIISDQLGLDALSAHGCGDVHTPNIDALIQRGVSFAESHSTSPVCSPARSSLFTGRMPVETGVITNNRPIHPSCPNAGQWLRQAGYDTVYCGKWHLPGGYPTEIPGFDVLPVGQGQGDLVDTVVSRTCEAYLKNRSSARPFLLVASLMQPHDICYWAIKNKQLVPTKLPFPQLAGRLPQLPANHKSLPAAPQRVNQVRFRQFTTDEQWRYYIYVYYRQVEMLDADVGRILNGLEAAGQAENTIVILTSDHGEGRGRHQNVQKWHPYDEAMKVPMIVSGPAKIAENRRDTTHLVCGLDVMSTMCDYAGIGPPPNARGKSLRPLLEGKPTQWRDFLGADCHQVGRIIRTAEYKYVKYPNDPVEQLFNMKTDPWETTNLYDKPKYADILNDHRKLLGEWEARLKPVPPTRNFAPSRKRNRKS